MAEDNKYCYNNNSNNFDELKIKSLEARLIGPSKNGLPPITSCYEDTRTILSSKIALKKEISNKLDQNKNNYLFDDTSNNKKEINVDTDEENNVNCNTASELADKDLYENKDDFLDKKAINNNISKRKCVNPNKIEISSNIISNGLNKKTLSNKRLNKHPPKESIELEPKKTLSFSKEKRSKNVVNNNNTLNSDSSVNSFSENDYNQLNNNNMLLLKEEYNNKTNYFIAENTKKEMKDSFISINNTVNTINNIYNTNTNRENTSNTNVDLIEYKKAYKNNIANTVLSNGSAISGNQEQCIKMSKSFNITEQKLYDSKLNHYFKQASNQKDIKLGYNALNSRFCNDESNPNNLYGDNSYFQEEIIKLKQELEEVNRKKTDKEVELNNLKTNYNYITNKVSELESELESSIEAKDRATESLVNVLRELEEMKRTKQKEWVNDQSFKIGKFTSQNQGMSIYHHWEEGVDMKKAKLELEEVLKEKEEEKKLRKKIGSNNYDKLEVHKFKIEMLNKQENDTKEKLVKLYKDRINLEHEEKRLNEENKCNYSKKQWPILNNRYLILSLIGKGGYSEVYKAYDLVQHINVACKIHQLDTNWSDNIKELYIRHTIRENKIHQKITHEKVVKHYNTVEIDNDSFATILELCSGPDLSQYLKLNGHLSEREAKIIIKQIIIGLIELHKMGIIHYDLKPQNIIFHKGEIKISDFGLAKEMENKDKIELTCLGVGTFYYLPPEIFDQSSKSMIDQKVDIWSVGVIFYELIYGIKPFAHNISQETILKKNLIVNSKNLEFPSDSKINVTKETQVSLL